MKAEREHQPPELEPERRATPRAPRGRPRKATTDEKILSATRELLTERGFDATSFEAIAQRAGVTRPAIYRRWPSKAHLISEVAVRGPGLPGALAMSEIGEIIAAWLQAMVDRYEQPDMKAALGGLVSTYQAAPELRLELEGSLEAKARKDFENAIRTNQEKGHVRKTVVPDTLFDIIVGAIFYRSLGSSFEASPDFVREICEIVLKGIVLPEDEAAMNPDRRTSGK